MSTHLAALGGPGRRAELVLAVGRDRVVAWCCWRPLPPRISPLLLRDRERLPANPLALVLELARRASALAGGGERHRRGLLAARPDRDRRRRLARCAPAAGSRRPRRAVDGRGAATSTG